MERLRGHASKTPRALLSQGVVYAMEPSSIITVATELATSSLEPVDVLVFISVVLVLFMLAITWKVLNVMERSAEPRRRR